VPEFEKHWNRYARPVTEFRVRAVYPQNAVTLGRAKIADGTSFAADTGEKGKEVTQQRLLNFTQTHYSGSTLKGAITGATPHA
jgi:hypothetical protein